MTALRLQGRGSIYAASRMMAALSLFVATLFLQIEPGGAAARPTELLHNLSALDTACDTLCSPVDRSVQLPSYVEGLATRLESAGINRQSSQMVVEALNRLIFEQVRVRPSADLKNPDNLFLFSKSLRLYPTDVWALNNRGLAYLRLGKREKARRDFEEALRILPGFETARRNLKGIEDPERH
jgi:tetratricopeptide (TPR) repeat protein